MLQHLLMPFRRAGAFDSRFVDVDSVNQVFCEIFSARGFLENAAATKSVSSFKVLN